jgi:hypothetical protein
MSNTCGQSRQRRSGKLCNNQVSLLIASLYVCWSTTKSDKSPFVVQSDCQFNSIEYIVFLLIFATYQSVSTELL